MIDTGPPLTAHLDGAIRDGRHVCRCASITRTPIFPASSITPTTCASWSAARTNYLRLIGADQRALFAQPQAEAPGFAFVVRSMQIDFLKPARMDDVLEVVTWPLEVKGASITLAQEVRRGDDFWWRPRSRSPSSAAAGRSRSRRRCGPR